MNGTSIVVADVDKRICVEALPGVLWNMETRPFISREQGNKCHFFRGTSSGIWGTGEHKILCANDIKYCYKEPFLEETQNGMVLVTLVLV